MSDKVILALDTATEYCSVALSAKGKVYLRELYAPQKHAALLLNFTDEILAEAEVSRDSIDLVAFGKGPGSFTGVRIAAAAAQGLALGLDIPLVGIDDLRMLAEQAFIADSSARFAVAAIDARMSEVYYALYEKNNDEIRCLAEPAVGSPADAAAAVCAAVGDNSVSFAGAGTGIAVLRRESALSFSLYPADDNNSDLLFPKAVSLIKIFEKGGCITEDAAAADPLYCRNEVVKKSACSAL